MGSRAWVAVAGFLVALGVCVLGGDYVAGRLLTPGTGEQDARQRAFRDADVLMREVQVAAPWPGDYGPEAVAEFRRRIVEDGDTVLGSGSVPGLPEPEVLAGWVDVRMVRSGAGGWWHTEQGTATVCLRYEIHRLADARGKDFSAHEVDCP
jgi:hypothetical protein